MSIFSRKSKSGQSQTVKGKQNGRAYSGSQQAKSMPIGQTVDPIVQRMAIQAASRRRMNGETPDYSIASASPTSSIRHSGNRVSSLPIDYEQRNSRVLQNDVLTKTASADPNAGRMTAPYPPKQTREFNKIRKSNAGSSPQSRQMTFPNGSDPDTQKMRMPWRDRGLPSPQISRDSGYSSVAASATMDSRTLRELDPPQEPELLRRHRKINASLSPEDDEQPKARTLSLPASQSPAPGRNSHDLPSTPRTVERDRRDSSTYISRLDPGSASSGFMSTAVAPQISKPKQPETSSPTPTTSRATDAAESLTALPSLSSAVTAIPEKSRRRKSVGSRKRESSNEATRDTSIPRESQPPPSKSEQHPRLSTYRMHRLDARPPQTKVEESVKPVQSSQVGQLPGSRTADAKEDDRRSGMDTISSRNNTMSNGTGPTTPYLTPKESQSPSNRSLQTSSPPKPRPPEPHFAASESNRAIDPPREGPVNQTSATASAENPVLSTSVPPANNAAGRPLLDAKIDTQPLSQMRFPSPQPQTEFPYLDGIEKGATVPPASVLEGYKVNRRGQILDEEGDIIGELVQGEIIQCVRRKINAQGDVVDDSGNIVGHARPLRLADTSPMGYERQDGSYQDSLRSPVSPATPQDRRQSAPTFRRPLGDAQKSNGVAERALNASDSEGNVVYFELDASVESQAVPMIDHSEIFIPPFGNSKSQVKSRSVTNLPETGRKSKRRKSTQAHTPSASQEKIILDGRQISRKRTSRYSDAVTTEDAVSKASTGQVQRPRSYSTVTNKAPRAVLGPTWESLLDTVPDPNQASSHRASVATEAIVQVEREASVRAQPGNPIEPSSSTSSPEKNNNSSGSMAVRRSSQAGVNTRASTIRPYANSPLSSVVHTPPGTSADKSNGSFQQQLGAPVMGGMQTSSTGNATNQGADEDDEAAPAPTVMKRTTAYSTKSAKSGVKRRSIFGFFMSRKEQVAN